MDNTRWEQVQTIFHAVVDLPKVEQKAALLKQCAEDPYLLVQVTELLREEDCSDLLLHQGLSSFADSLLADDTEAEQRLARQVGPYRIERLLGEGGMGVVYLAQRIDIGGMVAIKLLRDAWLSPERRRRFASEQKTLAQLSHPSIAKLYDADTLPDGTPWFVMEYIDGLPVTGYWDQRGGTMEECLLLFRQVCEAVFYAHSRAIIHRDLKPSNVLVTSEGTVKLLDFGIAKHLDDTENNATLTALRPMTPAYAAPEQQVGGQVGVFTDVYALGVLLYELLTGKLPFEEPIAARRPPGFQPARPSSFSKLERFSQPVSRASWADLNVLCLTAMHMDNDRRYSSVEALLRDIDAYLEKRPLQARPDVWSYRLGKFIRRQRIGLSYAAAAVLMLAAVVGFFTWRLQQARNAALAEAARTQRIQQFTANLFQGGDASVGPAEDLRVATLLDRGREEAQSLGGDPEMQADMWETLGNIYLKLGDIQKADSLLSTALDKRRAIFGPQHRKVAQNLVELGLARKEAAKLDEAETLIRQGLTMSQSLLRTEDPAAKSNMSSAMVALGSVLEEKGNYTEAIHILEQALKLQPRTDFASPALAENLRELANAQFYAGHYVVSESLNRQALTMHRTLYGEKHPEVAGDLNNLGAIQHELGNLHEAELYYRQSLAITEAWYGSDHPNTAEDLTTLGRTLVMEKRYDDAKPILERSLHIQTEIHGHDHPTVASALNELGNMASLRDQYDEAEKYFAEALLIWRDIYGNNHQFIGVGLSNLGSVYMGQKDYRKAEVMYRQAVQVFTETVREHHTNTGIAHLKLGRALLRQRRFSEAEPETLRGYQTLVDLVPPTNSFVVAARKDLAAIYIGLDRKTDAMRYSAEF